MDVDYGHIPKEELRDFFRSIKLKKKYYRLKSGAFVNLMTEDKQIDELRDLLSIGEVTEDNKIAFSQTAVMEVDECFRIPSELREMRGINSYWKI